MTSGATVSVIIPVYNGERFIRRALDSVLAQTLPAHEILVVDDGSRDRTQAIVEEEYAGQVRLLSQANGGPARARNQGMAVATGDFFAFLDADDWWEPGKLEAQVRALAMDTEAVGNYTGLRTVRESDGRVKDLLPIAAATLWPRLRWENPGVPPSSMMLRRSVVERVGGFNERQVGSEDWEMWIRVIRAGHFSMCAEPLTDYRVSAGGLSGNADHMFGDFLKMLEDQLLADLRGLKRAIWRRRIVSYQAFKAALTARGAGETAKEKGYMWRSVREWPSPLWCPRRFKYLAVTMLRR